MTAIHRAARTKIEILYFWGVPGFSRDVAVLAGSRAYDGARVQASTPGGALHHQIICNMGYRIGQGIDFHQLAEGRELWLGGVLIPSERGAVGHSDADVLLHAVCDALLGALSLGDIGLHFPNTDPTYKGIDSKILLARTYALIKEKGYSVVNLDTTVTLESPKIMKYAPAMRQTIAAILEITIEDVSIKATTTEKMGYVGRGEGLVAYASVLLEKR